MVQRCGECLADLVGADAEGARNALGQVAALDLDFLALSVREGRRHFLLDLFGRAFADQHPVIAAHVGDDRLVEAVTGHAQRIGVHDAAQGNHANFGGAAADVDHHRAGGFRDRQPCTDGSRHGFFQQIHLGSACAQRRFADGAPLHLGGATGNTDDDARVGREHRARMRHAHELLEHLFGDREVGNHAVLHRADGLHVAGNLAQHQLGLAAHGRDGALAARGRVGPDRHHRRLVQHDALALGIDQGVGRSQVDGQVVRKVFLDETEHDDTSLYVSEMAEGSYRYTSAHVRPWVRPGTAGRWPVVNVSFALQAYHRLGPLRAAGLFKFLVPERGAAPSARFRQGIPDVTHVRRHFTSRRTCPHPAG